METRLRVVCVTERLGASVVVRPSIRSTLSGMFVHVSDSLPNGGARENESGCVKEVEDGSDCGGLVHEDVPLRGTLRSKEEWYANVSVSVNGYLAGVNESKSVHLNVGESAI